MKTITLPEKSLVWKDKLLIFFAMAAQSYIVFIWYLKSLQGVHPIPDTIFAISAGVALDLGVMQSATGELRPSKKWHGGWAFWTPFIGFISSCLIAYDTYAASWFDPKAAVHLVFPAFVWAASQYVASKRRQRIDDWIDEQTRETVGALEQELKDTKEEWQQVLTQNQLLLDEQRTHQREMMSNKQNTAAYIEELKAEHAKFIALREDEWRKWNAEQHKVLQELQDHPETKPAITGTGKAKIRSILQAEPELSTAEIIARLTVDTSDMGAVRVARTQISQVKKELNGQLK